MPDYRLTPEGKVLLKRPPDGAEMEYNFTEELVPQYVLPDILKFENGQPVLNESDWLQRRRELISLFETLVYGRASSKPFTLEFSIEEPWTPTLNDTGLRKQVCITISTQKGSLPLHLLLYIPNNPIKKTPMFLGLNFNGNHSITTDSEINLNPGWFRADPENGIINHNATEASRGCATSRWPIQTILEAGFGVATMYYGDIDPDFDDGFHNGLHPLFYDENQTQPAADEWSSIGAWAFGLSRALDYLETEHSVDASKVAVIGHSRLGKTALWAGALDNRFAMVISNESGCGGAALNRRGFGEHVHAINHTFSHWFCGNFKQYNDNESALPIDQHQLLALIAPRPLYVASAEGDQWSDPYGEFVSSKEASVAYEFLNLPGLPNKEFPILKETDFSGTVAYHIRPGKHDLTEWDWLQFIAFAKKKI